MKVVVGTYGEEDLTVPVEFDGELLAYLDRHTETGTAGERLYRTPGGRLIVWARVSTEDPPQSTYSLHEVRKADLLDGGRFAEVGARADLESEPLPLNAMLSNPTSEASHWARLTAAWPELSPKARRLLTDLAESLAGK